MLQLERGCAGDEEEAALVGIGRAAGRLGDVAPTESAARTSCTPTVQRAKESQAPTLRCNESPSTTERR
jgi:hypothetical protein